MRSPAAPRLPSAWGWITIVAAAATGCGDDAPPSPVPTSVVGGAGGEGGQNDAGGHGAADTGGGGMQRSCWGDDPSVWPTVDIADRDALEGLTPTDPMLSGDGLSLLYTARESETSAARVFRATRDDLDVPFTGGEPIAAWPGYGPVSQPWMTGTQLFVAFDTGAGRFHLGWSVFDGTAWSFPSQLGALINDAGYSNSDPSLSADGQRLVFVRGEQGFVFDLVEARRDGNIAGQPFQSTSPVSLEGFDADVPLLCPALSGDGRRLFFSSTRPVTSTELSASGIPDGALRVWYSERATVDSPWGSPVALTVFDDPDLQTCVQSVRADGCELRLNRWRFGETGTYTMVVGRR